MAGPGSRDRTASRSAEAPPPARQTRLASRNQQVAETANVTAESAASPEPTHDMVGVATHSTTSRNRFGTPDPIPRRYARPPQTNDGGFTSPATNDFDDTTIYYGMTPGRFSDALISPNRRPSESVREREDVAGATPSGAQRTQEDVYPPEAVAQQDEDEEEDESSSSESEKEIQGRPDQPRPTYLVAARNSDGPAIGVVRGLEQNLHARESILRPNNSGTAPSQYQRGNQNPSQYLRDARAGFQVPHTPGKPNQSPSRDPLPGSSQANTRKRQRADGEDDDDDEEGEFETNNRPARQRNRINSRDSMPPSTEHAGIERQRSITHAQPVNGAGGNPFEHAYAGNATVHPSGPVPQSAEHAVVDRQGLALEGNHFEHNDAAGDQVNNGGLNAEDAIEITYKAREISQKYRNGPKKYQSRSPWPAADVAKLITAISRKGCSWSFLETDLSLSIPRNQQQMRDKARNIKVDFLLGDIPLPHGFDGIALGKKERERVISCERNPDRSEVDVDGNGNPTNCRYTG